MQTVLVAGGGIGGLAAALALARAGYEVVVLERRAEFSELGAGIQIGPNGFRALRALGVEEAVRRRAVFVDELRLMDGLDGRSIARLPLKGDYLTRFELPYAVVHRNELYGGLLDACRTQGRIRLSPGLEVVGYEQTADGVVARLSGGRRIQGRALIGADGIRSRIRGQLVGDGAPRISGHTIYRSVVPIEAVPVNMRSNTVTLWAGPGWHFVHYPIAEGRQWNMAATRDDRAAHEITGQPVDADRVLAEFDAMAADPAAFLRLGADWKRWVLCDRDPVASWVDGRVALLGDAAHPMLQYAAQGACMALEDAVVLGRAAAANADLPAVLSSYCAVRRARAGRVQMVSRRIGDEIYHARDQQARDRNRQLSSLGTQGLHTVVAWLHGARHFDEAA